MSVRPGPYAWVLPFERAEIAERVRAGATMREVAEVFGVSHTTVWRVAREAAMARRRLRHSPRPGCDCRPGNGERIASRPSRRPLRGGLRPVLTDSRLTAATRSADGLVKVAPPGVPSEGGPPGTAAGRERRVDQPAVD